RSGRPADLAPLETRRRAEGAVPARRPPRRTGDDRIPRRPAGVATGDSGPRREYPQGTRCGGHFKGSLPARAEVAAAGRGRVSSDRWAAGGEEGDLSRWPAAAGRRPQPLRPARPDRPAGAPAALAAYAANARQRPLREGCDFPGRLAGFGLPAR